MNTWRNLPGKAYVAAAALHPRLRARADKAAKVLSREERELFLSMKRYDLAHSLAVADRVRDDPFLYRAALLHDAGKLPSELGLGTRWLFTALELAAPGLLRRLCGAVEEKAEGDGPMERVRSLPRGIRRGLYVQAHHGEIAAELLRAWGSEDEMVRLVEEHQHTPRDARARRLRDADDAL
ncbi:MAG: hypothetical protein HPY75_09315 [Actinobacteria bacterium]|nr:hypothetical protein [Actinomycetota bacterium]